MTATSGTLPPIDRSVDVSWSPEEAFDRFTARFAQWWPKATHSIGGPNVKDIFFETRVGGRIYEQHIDGRRFQWGVVTEFDPPHRVRFSWHPSRDESTAQDVVVTFEPRACGTHVRLVSSGWERWGKGAAKARKGYDMGWSYILNDWGGKRTFAMSLMDGLMSIMMFLQIFKGGRARVIRDAGGEMKP